ncbi:hypothetical protein AVEN_136022-1 [Araneus ventricosus]|uniref:Uncharacterized protein n=1 Tax=Araneus ventricosus TaxID=182803 RepID=A0A4Y2EUB1_ARAVE|nr:hypothetical protein AVEN_136022-1 [Araneus ventricosus]
MGDANPQEERREMENDDRDMLLENLDEGITDLSQTMRNLEGKTLRAISCLAINFALALILLAAAIFYLTHQHFFGDEKAEKEMLYPVLLLLTFLSATLWIPTYLGALWEIYYFRQI